MGLDVDSLDHIITEKLNAVYIVLHVVTVTFTFEIAWLC